MIWLYIIGLSFIGAFLSYLGGEGFKPARTIGTNLCAIAIFMLRHNPISMWWWILPLVFILQYFTLNTRWKGNAPDVLKHHWLLTGVMWGVSAIPYYFIGGSLAGIISRIISLGLLVMFWSEKEDNVFKEEFGRGMLFTWTTAAI